MNEINDIKAFIKVICQKEVVLSLEKIVAENAGGKIFLVFPKVPSRQKDLHLFVEDEKELNLVKGAELTGIIKRTLDYDYTSDDIGAQIEVTYSSRIKKGRENEVFEDKLPLTEKTIEDGSVEQFFARHYSSAVPSLRAKTTERKNSDEENFDRSERLLSLLKSDPALWEKFLTDSGSWDLAQKEVGEQLKKESLTSSNKTNLSHTT
jgi:hypothetical protein